MSTEGEASTNRRGEPRVSFDGAVRLRYRLFQEFLEENAANISTGGMFIRTIHPGELGAELDFEIRLDDDFALIEGRGEITWVRREADEPNAEPGMGIRFIELAGESIGLVDKIVRERVAAGLELFDLEGHAPAVEAAPAEPPVVTAPPDSKEPIWELDSGDAAPADAAAGDGAPIDESVAGTSELENLVALDPEVPRPIASQGPAPPADSSAARLDASAAARSRSRPLRLIAVAVLSALVGAGAVLAFYWLWVEPSIDALETRIDELAGSPGGPWQPPADEPALVAAAGVEAAAGGEAAGGGEAPAAISGAGQSSEVVDALRGWAAAWTEQRATDYVAYYATSFEPPDGLDRPAWEEARRARIARPQWIRVALTLVEVEATGPDAADVRFVQSYRSERYKDLVRKRMLMVREDGGWKIAAERTAQ